jgi:hypothetical protein
MIAPAPEIAILCHVAFVERGNARRINGPPSAAAEVKCRALQRRRSQ